MKVFALYKLFSGCEWLIASMQPWAPHVDGFVLVESSRPWRSALRAKGNAREYIAKARALPHLAEKMTVVHYDAERQEEQYRVGLEKVKELGGEMAIVVDADEIWPESSAAHLRSQIRHNGQAVYKGQIRTYVRSPLYQVWPLERNWPTVAVPVDMSPIHGRFSGSAGRKTVELPNAVFDHYSYVRESEKAIAEKFITTSSQEAVPIEMGWMGRVWDQLPDGENLHMSVGFEACWGRLRVLAHGSGSQAACETSVYKGAARKEHDRWEERLRSEHPECTYMPVANPRDVQPYEDLLPFSGAELKETFPSLRCAIPEVSVLAGFARHCGRPDAAFLEIGSGHGGSTWTLAAAGNGARIVAIDPFEPYDETTHAGTARGVTEGDLEAFRRNAKAGGYEDRLSLIKKRSLDPAAICEARERMPEGGYSLILVDGNHSADIVAAELPLCWQMLAPGGVMLAHDFSTRFPGVIAGVDAARAQGIPLHVHCGTTYAFAIKGLQ